MTLLALSLGSNIEREKHIFFALKSLQGLFGKLDISPVYETRALGFKGPDFYNLVVVVHTLLELDALHEKLQQIEHDAGRVRDGKGFESRVLDIDMLLFGDANLRDEGRNIPRDEIDHAAYVLKPLAEVLPDMRHPVSGQRFKRLWANFCGDSLGLRRIEFDLRDFNVA